MVKVALAAALLLGAVGPAAAEVRLNVRAVMPVSCEVTRSAESVWDGGGELTIDLSCNTVHVLRIEVPGASASLELVYAGRSVTGGRAEFTEFGVSRGARTLRFSDPAASETQMRMAMRSAQVTVTPL